MKLRIENVKGSRNNAHRRGRFSSVARKDYAVIHSAAEDFRLSCPERKKKEERWSSPPPPPPPHDSWRKHTIAEARGKNCGINIHTLAHGYRTHPPDPWRVLKSWPKGSRRGSRDEILHGCAANSAAKFMRVCVSTSHDNPNRRATSARASTDPHLRRSK